MNITNNSTIAKPLVNKEQLSKIIIFSSLILVSADAVYKYFNGINYLSKYKCVLYQALPRWLFLFYEYFIELFLLVIVGIFAAAIIERYFSRMKRFMPKNPFTAFVYASIIPLCSCSVIPLINAMKTRMPFRSVMTFVIAAPLLNPYIIMLSVTVLGVRYAVLRIVSSLVLSITTGYIAEYFFLRWGTPPLGTLKGCNPGSCILKKPNVYETAFETFKKVFPFLVLAGMLGIITELFVPSNMLNHLDLSNNVIGTVIVILIGVPVYFCNGADVLFLQPLIQYAQLPIGTAIAFSLTSTSVCASSIVLLSRFIGKKMTALVVSCIVLLTFSISMTVHLLCKI